MPRFTNWGWGEPAVIGDQPEALSDDAWLINLRAEGLAPWRGFGRVFDVAVQEPDILRQTRSHFRLC